MMMRLGFNRSEIVRGGDGTEYQTIILITGITGYFVFLHIRTSPR
jgi:hypothetical protein